MTMWIWTPPLDRAYLVQGCWDRQTFRGIQDKENTRLLNLNACALPFVVVVVVVERLLIFVKRQ
jgi:hypothetical protein